MWLPLIFLVAEILNGYPQDVYFYLESFLPVSLTIVFVLCLVKSHVGSLLLGKGLFLPISALWQLFYNTGWKRANTTLSSGLFTHEEHSRSFSSQTHSQQPSSGALTFRLCCGDHVFLFTAHRNQHWCAAWVSSHRVGFFVYFILWNLFSFWVFFVFCFESVMC